MSDRYSREPGADPAVSPLAMVAVAVVAVSTSAILVRWSDAPSLVKAFYRVLFTTLVVAPVAVGRYGGDLRRVGRRDLLAAVVAGVLLAVHFGTWFESLNHTSVAASVTLVQAQVVFVALGAALLLGERLTARVVGGIAIAFAGTVVMFFGAPLYAALSGAVFGGAGSIPGPASGLAGPASLYGNALALAGAVTAAGYLLAGRSLRQRVAVFPYVTVVYAVCTVVLFALVAARGYPFSYPAHEFALFAAMALGPGLFGHTIINWALAHLESSVVSVSLLAEPVASTVLALALLAEVPSAATVVGGAIVLVGIGVTALR